MMQEHSGKLLLGDGHVFAMAPWAMEAVLSQRPGVSRTMLLDQLARAQVAGYYCMNCGLSLGDVMRVISLMKTTAGVYCLQCVPRAAVVKAVTRSDAEQVQYDALAGYGKTPAFFESVSLVKAALDARTEDLDGHIPVLRSQ